MPTCVAQYLFENHFREVGILADFTVLAESLLKSLDSVSFIWTVVLAEQRAG